MNSRSRFGAASAGLASVACLLALVLGSNLALAGTFTPVTVTDQTPTAPLANPTPSSYQPRYISGFGLDNSFTVFFEDRDAGYTVSYNSTSIGPTGFSASNTASTIAPETHFCVKPWPINVGGTDYDYRAWGAVGNNMDHRFYVSNDMVNWTLVSTFTISNDAGWGGARGWVYYGFHDVILINGTYYAFAESNQSQTMLCRSANGDDVWEAFASLGGSQAGDGPLQLPVGISYGWTPTGNFLDLGYDRGYGKVYAHPGDSDFYLAVNTAAQASMAPATLEAAFINPTNWSWHDGTTGPAANAILSETVEHDLRECWVVPNSDPGDDWVIIYDADFGAGDGGKALGYATLTPPAGPKVHNITQGTDHNTIQEGIDAAIAGDVIEVDAGMYREQLYIDKTLNLTGAGIGSSIIEAPDPGDRTSYSITQWTGSTRNIDAVIGVDDAGTVNISGFTVDGRNTGPDNFYGIHFYNTDGSVTHCQIEDITYPASPGAQKVVSVVATHGLGETISIDFSDNEIPNLQKGGILLMGPGCTFTVDRNAVTDSESDDIAGNGIQLSYGATGTTEDNVVQGVGYSGTDWAGTGILLFESGSISMDGDEVFDCEGAVNFSDWGWIYLHPVPVNLGFANLNLHDNEWTLGAQLSRDNSDPTITITDCTINNSAGDGIDVYGTGMDPWGGSYYTGWENGDLILTITGCLISNTTGYDGLWTHDLSGNTTNNSTLNVNYNSFVNHADYAVNHNLPETMDATNCWWGDPTGPSTTKRGGGESQAIAMVQPYGCNLPTKGHALAKPVSNAKTGGSIHGSIDYVPFLTGDIICVPDPQEISLADAGYQDDVDVHYLGGSGAVYGYSIEVQWDSTVVVGSFSKPASGPFQTAQFFQVIPFDASHVRVDCALGGAGAGTLGPDDLFKCTFTAVGTPDYATTSVDLTILSLRDNNNQPLTAYVDNGEVIVDLVGPSVTNVLITNTTLTHTNDYIKDSDNAHVYANVTDGGPGVTVTANLSGLGGGALVAPGSFDSGDADWDYTVNTGSAVESNVNVTVTATDDLGNSSSASDVDGIMLDNIAPTAITGFNAEPHHERVALSWDNPSGLDTYYYGVVVRFDSSSVYPVYGSPGIYPADESGGDGDAYNNTGAVTGGDHTVSNPRSIYYYRAFAYDWAMNYGPAADSAKDRATNYWLGDVTGSWTPGSEDYDGSVDAGDVSVLSGVYWTSGLSWSATECDVGPTDDGSRLGIPTVDDQIQFEDMMIFAMNFNVVSPTGMPPVVQLAGRPEAGPPVLRLESTEMAKGMTVSLCLGGNTAEVKAVSMVLTYDPEILEMVSVTPTLADQVLFEYREAQPGEVWVDLAALGTDVAIQGSGEIAQITFDVKSDGDMNIRFAEADLRGVSNGRLSSSTEGLAFDFRSSTPSVTELAGAWPNPFNPTTSIQYNLRHAEHVTLQIYDAQGRLVRTLVNETMNAGRYSTVWNGRDNNGVEVSSGTYFVRMHTSRYESTSKVVMLK